MPGLIARGAAWSAAPSTASPARPGRSHAKPEAKKALHPSAWQVSLLAHGEVTRTPTGRGAEELGALERVLRASEVRGAARGSFPTLWKERRACSAAWDRIPTRCNRRRWGRLASTESKCDGAWKARKAVKERRTLEGDDLRWLRGPILKPHRRPWFPYLSGDKQVGSATPPPRVRFLRPNYHTA